MKKEINVLLQSESSSLRLNNFSYLRRWQVDGLGCKCDKLVLEFDNINGTCFSIYDNEISSRSYDGILLECEQITNKFFNNVSKKLINDFKGGKLF